MHHPRACYLDGSRDWQEQDQQLVAVGPGNGRNSFLVARWRPPQVAECRVRRRCRGLYYGATAVPWPLPPLLLRLLLVLVLLYSQFGDSKLIIIN